jgi:hypothetical protein
MMQSDSAFMTPLAVETWDAWFRWRDRGQLRDRTIDATWERVATCLSRDRSAPHATITGGACSMHSASGDCCSTNAY